MTPERIAEIAHDHAEFCIDSGFLRVKKGIQDAIEQALAEENRWFYPEKDKYPDDNKPILCCLGLKIIHGYVRGNIFIPFSWDINNIFKSQIKCWRYAPEVPE